MTDHSLRLRQALGAAALALAALPVAAQPAARPAATSSRAADYIVAVVNRELVTAAELQGRIDRIRQEAARTNAPLPPPAELRRQVLDTLIDERVLVTNARETGPRIDESELDRAVASVAQQNQLTVEQLRERLRREGIAFDKFRDNIRDQLLVERVREREVLGRIRVTEAEVDAFLAARRDQLSANPELNIAQILVSVPEGADEAAIAERRARAEAALARVRAGEDFAAVAREVSDDANRAAGGELGLRPADRLPDLFVQATAPLAPGEVTPQLLRSGAGFHVLKVVERQSAGMTVQQTRARHILLRTSAEVTAEAAAQRLQQMKRELERGSRTFEQLARENSQDSTAQAGGEIGWVAPGSVVAEFEQAMNALPVGGVSEPVESRFGVHLIQVVERRTAKVDPRQIREQARNILREQKFEQAFQEWIRDLRARAYIELREPPQ